MSQEVTDWKRNVIPSVGPGVSVEEEGINFQQVFDLLRAGRWTVLVVAVAIFLIGVFYVVLVSPTYEADGLVQVEDDSKGSTSQMSQISSLLLGTPVETEAEIQILQSRLVLDQVIDQMNLMIDASPKHFPIIGNAIARHNATESEPVAVPSFLRRWGWGGEKIDIGSFEVPPSFWDIKFTLSKTKDGYILLSPSGDKILEGKIGEQAVTDSPIGHVSILVKDLVAQPGTRFGLIRWSRPDVLMHLSKLLTVQEQGKQSGVIQVSFVGHSPEYVTEFVRDLEKAYLRQNVERRQADAQKSLEFLEIQLPLLKEKVGTAQARLNAYQLQHGSVDVSGETQLVLQQSVDLETQRLQLEQQRDEARQRFTPQHPVLRALEDQIKSLESARDKIKQRVEKLPSTQQEIYSLTQELDVNSELYTEMMDSIQSLQIAKAGTVGNVRIIDDPLEPFLAKTPKVPMTLLISAVLGLVLGAGFVLIQRAMLRGIDDPAEMESRFGLTTYALIPYSKEQRAMAEAMNAGRAGDYILATKHADSPAVEALRSLRTSLHFALLESPNNIVMFTGPSPGLGKSFITANLSAILAASGKRVALIDCDMRRGYLHTYFSKPVTPGLADYIAGDADLSAITLTTAIDGLHVITRGVHPPNPSELLLHERFAELLKALSTTYDYVLLDTPPVLPVTDAAIIGRLAGCTLLVLKAAEHPITEIDIVLKRLASAGVQVKGVLFNLVGIKLGSYGYGDYGYKYYKYGPS